ncbi:MAG: helix-turn-helix domain-containing protein [Armatimonadetes bacterium]|nr:helix-turn-helix domain-containing protein [Armatimonadota bacterium]
MEVLTVPQVAEMLHLSGITVYRLAKTGKIPAKKVGRCWRFSKQVIEKWLAQGSSWEEDVGVLLREMQVFAKKKGITQRDIKKAIDEVRRQKSA